MRLCSKRRLKTPRGRFAEDLGEQEAAGVVVGRSTQHGLDGVEYAGVVQRLGGAVTPELDAEPLANAGADLGRDEVGRSVLVGRRRHCSPRALWICTLAEVNAFTRPFCFRRSVSL